MLVRGLGVFVCLAVLVLAGCGGGGGGGDALTLGKSTVDITGGNGPQNRVTVNHAGGTRLSVGFAPGQDTRAASCIGMAWQDLDSQGPWYVEPINNYRCTSSPVILRVSLCDAEHNVLAYEDLTVITLH